jgi:hypothetical protein
MEVCCGCETRVRKALAAIPGFWADLGDTRTGWKPHSGSGGSGGVPQPLSDDRRNARSAIRAGLVSWCLILEEDFSVTLPADTVRAMAHCIAVQAGRLLASEHADQLVCDLLGFVDEAGRHSGILSEARRVLNLGTGHAGVTVPCPSCGSRVHVQVTDDEIRCSCGEWGVPRWWVTHAVPGSYDVMATADVLSWLAEHHRIRLHPSTITRWVDAGKLMPRERPDDAGVVGQGRPTMWFVALDVAEVAIARRCERASA